jgi:hypothetical protein
MPDSGQPLSPQAADLVRRLAQGILDEPVDLMAEIYTAVSAAADEPLRSEPVLAAEVAASTRANVLAWAAGIARDPGGRVPPNLAPEVLGIAREAFRRGIEQTVYTTYHAGQNVVQAYWMRAAFALSADPAVLRQALAPARSRWPASSRTWSRRCRNSCGASGPNWPAAATRAGSRWSASSWTAPPSPPRGPAPGWATTCAAGTPPRCCGPSPAARIRPRSPPPPRPSAR